jgi:hypothetical protein
MANRRLVRARSDCGAALALLDLDIHQEALLRLLRHRPVKGYLVVALTIENAPTEVVAADVGIHRAHLVGALREAVVTLALEYEAVTFADAVAETGLLAAMRMAKQKRC